MSGHLSLDADFPALALGWKVDMAVGLPAYTDEKNTPLGLHSKEMEALRSLDDPAEKSPRSPWSSCSVTGKRNMSCII